MLRAWFWINRSMTRDLSHPHVRRRVVTPDEARVWRAVAETVTPLPGRALPPDEDEAVASPPPAVSPAADNPVPPPRSAAPRAIPPLLPALRAGETPGLDRRSADRLKRGEMAIDDCLDLHGMTQDSAHARLTACIARAFESGRRCVLVITGKGRDGAGILRAQVPRWLNQSPLRERVLGFSIARNHHGGEGALYVLVKRRR
jgi:DNA-nicking Smr family endonuclease